MENVTSERSLLSKTLKPVSGMASASATNNLRGIQIIESPYKGYNPFAVEKNDLRTFPSYPFGQQLEVSGRIFDAAGKLPLAKCILEVWHLSPNSINYNHRAKLNTNAFGEYLFITDRPGRAQGENYKIFFKVSKGNHAYFTKLSFNNIQAYIWGLHSERNNPLGDDLLSLKNKTKVNKTSIVFNINLQEQGFN